MDFGSGPDMAVMSSPLVDGLVAFDKSQLEFKALDLKIKECAAEVDVYGALVDQYSHTLDAIRYRIMAGAAKAAPPPPDPSWPAEVQEAHKALYAELPQYKAPDTHDQIGHGDANFYFKAMVLNDRWMAKVETEAAPVRRSAWEKLKGWLKS